MGTARAPGWGARAGEWSMFLLLAHSALAGLAAGADIAAGTAVVVVAREGFAADALAVGVGRRALAGAGDAGHAAWADLA